MDEYLASLSSQVELLVVDGSEGTVFDEHRVRRSAFPIRHVRPEMRLTNGKVAGVLTGLGLASHEFIIIADDDVRYDDISLRRVANALGRRMWCVIRTISHPCRGMHASIQGELSSTESQAATGRGRSPYAAPP